MSQKGQPEVHRGRARHEVDEHVRVSRVRLHTDRQLVRKQPGTLRRAIAEDQPRILVG